MIKAKSSDKKATLLFADASVETLERDKTLPSKFERMLKRIKLQGRVEGKHVTIKMHIGNDIGFTTIHPVFVRILVQFIKDAGAESVVIMDGKDPKEGIPRGYTSEVIGCPIISCFGESGKHYVPEQIGFRELDEALLSGEALDREFFIDLSHLKGHGDCGFGGALKNIAMGLVPQKTRGKIHKLEGGLVLDKSKCKYCLKCFDACPNEAIWKDDKKKEITFFFHNCTYCQHCVMVCPEDAITMENRRFEDFSQGMALVTAAFLKKFRPENLLFINFLTNITIYCDCWGFSTPSLVPDIGIIIGDDIAAVDTASLDMIKTEDLLPNGLPKGRELLDIEGHLFERLFAKNPYLMIKYLTEYYDCTTDYEIREVR